MTALPVFVSAPWQLGPMLREELYERLRRVGVEPVSTWVYQADGAPEDFHAIDDATKRAACETNDRDIHRAAAVLLVTRPHLGSACFGEANYALRLRKPVIWVGPRFNLDAWRPGVVRVDDVDQALVLLSAMRHRYGAEGSRGFRLLEVGA